MSIPHKVSQSVNVRAALASRFAIARLDGDLTSQPGALLWATSNQLGVSAMVSGATLISLLGTHAFLPKTVSVSLVFTLTAVVTVLCFVFLWVSRKLIVADALGQDHVISWAHHVLGWTKFAHTLDGPLTFGQTVSQPSRTRAQAACYALEGVHVYLSAYKALEEALTLLGRNPSQAHTFEEIPGPGKFTKTDTYPSVEELLLLVGHEPDFEAALLAAIDLKDTTITLSNVFVAYYKFACTYDRVLRNLYDHTPFDAHLIRFSYMRLDGIHEEKLADQAEALKTTMGVLVRTLKAKSADFSFHKVPQS